MTKLTKFLNVIGYEIHDKFLHQRSIFTKAESALVCEISHGDNHCWLTCTFDVITQEVLEIVAEDYKNKRNYRWTHEDFRDKQESDKTATGQTYMELEVAEDILEKSDAIISGQEYDTRVTMPIDLTDEEFIEYALAAHKMDVTLNRFVEIAITAAVKKYNLDK
jgi:hypothetical protein